MSRCLTIGLARLLFVSLVGCGGPTGVTGTQRPFDESDEARLGGLSLSAGDLDYPFNPDDWTYSARVDHSVDILTVTPTAMHRAATILVNGDEVESGVASDSIALHVGENSVDIEVVAENGTRNAYRLAVYRAPSSNASLAALEIVGRDLDESFDPDKTDFHASLSYDADQIEVVATAAHSDARVFFFQNGADVADPASIVIVEGTNDIEIVVVAADQETTKTYLLTVTRQSNSQSDANLAFLSVQGISLDPPFDSDNPEITQFAAQVRANVSEVAVVATPVSASASVEFARGGVQVDDPQAIPLAEGENVIVVRVIAGNQTTVKEYQLSITRQEAQSDARLDSILLTMGDNLTERPLYRGGFDPQAVGFDSEVLTYAAVIWGFDSVTVAATAADPDVASLSIDGQGEPVDGFLSSAIPLTQGKVTKVEIAVTSSNGSVTQTYEVLVRLLNIYEFYYGVYAPVQRASRAEWYARVNNAPDLGLDETYNGAEHGSMHWTISLSGLEGRNRLDFDHYNNGAQGFPYIERGWQEHGRLESMISISGNGLQEGTLELSSHEAWGDKVADITYHLTISSKQPVEGGNSYTDCVYMGETMRSYYRDSSARDSLAEWDPNTPWTADIFE